jgi:hypothetical protein
LELSEQARHKPPQRETGEIRMETAEPDKKEMEEVQHWD